MATSDGDKDVMSELMKIPLYPPPFNRRVQELFFFYTEAYTSFYTNPWLKLERKCLEQTLNIE